MGRKKRLEGSKMLSMFTPRAVQMAVPMTDTERYPKDVAVSGSKQSAGMTLRSSLAEGKSSFLQESAFPLVPCVCVVWCGVFV